MPKKSRQQIIDLSFLSKLRTQKGYSQYELSLITGIKEKRIKKIEASKINPTTLELIQITKSLGFDIKISSINPNTIFHSEEIISI